MHKDVLKFVEKAKQATDINHNAYVLEIGSRNWNGTPRHLFGDNYIGIDLVDGDGVDLVMDGADTVFDPDTFDVVLCLEVLEHTDKKDLIVREMIRVLKMGGVGIVTAAAPGRPEHDGGTDFYENVTHEFMYNWLKSFKNHYIEIGNNEVGTPDIRGYFVK